MSTYAIGDLQGCFYPLMDLLKKISFNHKQDCLWFTGDLVNRGPHSLATLRFIKSLADQVVTVLGNHDLTLLAVAHNAIPYDSQQHTFADILHAPDCSALIQWLRQQPLLHHDANLGFTLVHAGLHPSWDLALAKSLAKEVEISIQGPRAFTFFENLYGNEPVYWDPQLKGMNRLRFITNCFTRLRFCTADGQLDLTTTASQHDNPQAYLPWFSVPNRRNKDLKILFGHWSALEGKCSVPHTFALDTGCVWRKCLKAMRLEDGQVFTTNC